MTDRSVRIAKFTTKDECYQKALALRDAYLRIPLDLSLADEDLTDEGDQLHYGLFEGGQLVACVTLMPIGSTKAKLKQMVVEQSRQGQGLGRELIEEMERLAKKEGIDRIEMAARCEAIGFYRNLGYSAEGDVFTEVGIDHMKMSKGI